MKIPRVFVALLAIGMASLCAHAQGTIVIHDPTVPATPAKLSAGEQSIMDKSVLPPARAKLTDEVCEEAGEVAGAVQGSFTRAGARQTLIFYQFCQTGNGIGSVGVAVIEDGALTAHYISAESAWTADARALPDINQNGINEIALHYSGGMHQGAGGVGVEIMEVSGDELKGIGWFQAESFDDLGPVIGYKVTVKPGKTPAFYKEKYIQNSASKWRRAGTPLPLKLTPVNYKFETLK